MNVKFKIRNVERVKKYLENVPKGTVRVALIAISEWLIGDSQSGLRHPEPYKFVSRKSAYGKTGATFENGKPVPAGYFSAKQFRYVMWKISTGDIKPGQNNRTGESENAWHFTPQEKGKTYVYKLQNDTPGGFWTRDDKRQARQLGKVGWWKVSEVVKKNMTGALKAARQAVNNFLKSK